jgi:transcriptional regulator with XRE-family HTH domain
MNNVKDRRLELKMTQRDLLAKLKGYEPRLDIGTLSRIESGICLPSKEVLEGLETALQASRYDLFNSLEIFSAEDTEAVPGRITYIVEGAVPEGKENAISREELAAKLGVSDRTMREWLESAKKDGLLIANDQDGKGYYQPVTEEEIRRQEAQMKNRIMTQLRQLKYLRRARFA